MYKIFLAVVAAILLMIMLSGCHHTEKTAATIKAPAYADAITEIMLKALNIGDYTSFSMSFNADMSERVTESVFQQLVAFYQQRIGGYKSKKLSDVTVDGDKTTVVYKAKFTQEPADVTVTIVFQKSSANVTVCDFWLNSPKLFAH
jgi:hypothetical protein